MIILTKPALHSEAYSSSLCGDFICGKSTWTIFLCCMWLCITHCLHCAKYICNFRLLISLVAPFIVKFWDLLKKLWHFLVMYCTELLTCSKVLDLNQSIQFIFATLGSCIFSSILMNFYHVTVSWWQSLTLTCYLLLW